MAKRRQERNALAPPTAETEEIKGSIAPQPLLRRVKKDKKEAVEKQEKTETRQPQT